ncbi:DUF4430 domain-containing protein [Mobilitalea sibirica]|uniref:DUF4430 domain-containing protein n=1 Tax=Mobilitalea sibirica TaxID=1462919 RepID=A0A8J7H0V9_9FIRM|nr:DUF4430 domain-containing protein [Mobilitalea sibirica]MBH1939555.1 DUF4430 domain-containing protein [Mobilitalea sibirica]
MRKESNFKKTLIATLLMLAVVAVMVVVYYVNRPETVKGAKEITIEVAIPEEKTKEYTLHTDAEFLRQALDEEKLIGGKESEYGFYITEVDGRTADDAKQEWWLITKGGEDVFTGVDEIAIQDGDKYELTLTVGY